MHKSCLLSLEVKIVGGQIVNKKVHLVQSIHKKLLENYWTVTTKIVHALVIILDLPLPRLSQI